MLWGFSLGSADDTENRFKPTQLWNI